MAFLSGTEEKTVFCGTIKSWMRMEKEHTTSKTFLRERQINGKKEIEYKAVLSGRI